MEQSDERQSIQSIVNRLQRIEGQVRGLQKMVTEGRDGVEILMQVSAVLSATRRVAGAIASYQIAECLAQAGEDADPDDMARLQAVVEAFSRLD